MKFPRLIQKFNPEIQYFNPLLGADALAALVVRSTSVGDLSSAPKLEDTVPYLSQILQPNDQTLEGSFSAVSTPIFASKYSLESIFRDLQYLHTFAPLRSQKIQFKIVNIFAKLKIENSIET